MLDKKGFDLWADGYDRAVGISDEDGTYPFAGYKQLLNEIYNRVLDSKACSVLDIGFGTGTLSYKLSQHGIKIYGQDFSERMIEITKSKIPTAELYQGNFADGLAEELKHNKYDAIIATYSLHHLPDDKKVSLISELLTLLNDGGAVYIGDVAFETAEARAEARLRVGEEWDDDEFYFAASDMQKAFPDITFERFSFCAGLLCLKKL